MRLPDLWREWQVQNMKTSHPMAMEASKLQGGARLELQGASSATCEQRKNTRAQWEPPSDPSPLSLPPAATSEVPMGEFRAVLRP